jgi:hypothetical protein
MKKHIFLIDFDDTLVNTSEFLINIYNQISSDHVDIKDFIEMDTWRLIPRYRSLFSEIVNAVVDDPTCIPPLPGSREFLEFIFVENNCQIIILSKRYIGKAIYDYLKNIIRPQNWDCNRIRIVFVEKSSQKALLEQRIDTSKYHLHLFEDRLPVHEEFKQLSSAWMYHRPWNDRDIFNYKGNNRTKFHYYNNFHDVMKIMRNEAWYIDRG